MCKRERERRGKSRAVEKGARALIAAVEKIFLIYLGHRSRMGPSVSPHGGKTQPEKNNTLNLSSVQLQIGGRARGREAEIERNRRSVRKKMEIGRGSQGEADAAMPVDKRKIHLSQRNKASAPSLLHSL